MEKQSKIEHPIKSLYREAIEKFPIGSKFIDLVHNKEFTIRSHDFDNFAHCSQIYVPVEKNDIGNKTARLYKDEIWAQKVEKGSTTVPKFEWNVGDWVVNASYGWNSTIESSDKNRNILGLVGQIERISFFEKEQNYFCFAIRWINGNICGKDSTQVRKALDSEIPIKHVSPEMVSYNPCKEIATYQSNNRPSAKIVVMEQFSAYNKYFSAIDPIDIKKEKIKANIIPVKNKQILI